MLSTSKYKIFEYQSHIEHVYNRIRIVGEKKLTWMEILKTNFHKTRFLWDLLKYSIRTITITTLIYSNYMYTSKPFKPCNFRIDLSRNPVPGNEFIPSLIIALLGTLPDERGFLSTYMSPFMSHIWP